MTELSVLDPAFAAHADANDPLARFRQRFVNAEPALIYMDGNSLGRLPLATQQRATEVIEREWGERLIRGWNEEWFTAPERIGAKIARLIGAHEDEVIIADSTSVNLFKLVVAALRYQRDRRRVVTDDLNFPSDVYILRGALDLLGQGHSLQIVGSRDGIYGPDDDLIAALDGDTALLTLSHTVFKSGYIYDMATMSAAAHDAGALVLWDLSHSVGAMPIDLTAAQADLAVGCTYKYLNGGPGAPAFLYVRRELQEELGNPLAGWMGQHNLFAFELAYQPAAGMRHFLTGTPPIVSLSLVEPGVDLLLEAGVDNVRRKSEAQTTYLIDLWEARLAPLGFTLQSPRTVQRRGSHVALGHPDGLGIDLALIDQMNVLPDFRAPDSIRLGIAPLYTSFADIRTAVLRLETVVTERRYEQYGGSAPAVT